MEIFDDILGGNRLLICLLNIAWPDHLISLDTYPCSRQIMYAHNFHQVWSFTCFDIIEYIRDGDCHGDRVKGSKEALYKLIYKSIVFKTNISCFRSKDESVLSYFVLYPATSSLGNIMLTTSFSLFLLCLTYAGFLLLL